MLTIDNENKCNSDSIIKKKKDYVITDEKLPDSPRTSRRDRDAQNSFPT